MLQTVSNRSSCLLLQVAMAGDFILAVASMMIARLRDDDVTITLSQVTRVCVHVCLLCMFAGRTSRQTCLHVLLDK
jgi:decaprenyl-diphosphate synthase subunit 1